MYLSCCCCLFVLLVCMTCGVPADTGLCARVSGALCEHICVSLDGESYECQCRTGYKLAPNGSSCLPVGGEILEPQREPDPAVRHSRGSQRNPGLTDGSSEADPSNASDLRRPVQEAGNRSDASSVCSAPNSCSQVCAIVDAVAQCSCHRGYELAQDNATCVDIDECARRVHLCREADICFNEPGGYGCVDRRARAVYRPPPPPPPPTPPSPPPHPSPPLPQTTPSNSGIESAVQCPSGFIFNQKASVCDDLDECSFKEPVCRELERCENSVGSYRCVEQSRSPQQQQQQQSAQHPPCAAGYKFDTVFGACIDIDECRDDRGACDSSATQRCVNTPGSFLCVSTAERQQHDQQCPPGFKPSNGSDVSACQDVNECEEKVDGCDTVNETCRNTIGGYECDVICQSGFEYNAVDGQCVDIDECELAMSGGGSGHVTLCPADTACVNTDGGFQCRALCDPGYRQADNGSCVDIDECQLAETICGADQICINRPGKHYCIQKTACPLGFQYSHSLAKCQDIDECAEDASGGANPCSSRGETVNTRCINLLGTFLCVPPVSSQGQRPSQQQQHQGQRPQVSSTEFPVSSSTTERSLAPGQRSGAPGQRSGAPGQRPLQPLSHRPYTLSGQRTHQSSGQRPATFTPLQSTERSHLPPCPAGFRRQGVVSGGVSGDGECVDIDECSEGIHACNAISEGCENVRGWYRCIPLTAYSMITSSTSATTSTTTTSSTTSSTSATTSITTTSADDAPRRFILPRLKKTERVPTTESASSYTTVRTFTRNVGLSTDPPVVLDRAYEANTESGSSGLSVSESAGAHVDDQRACPTGLTYHNDARRCVDVNECMLESGVCGSHGRCVNTPGSYRCHCMSGFKLDRQLNVCVDINECQLDIHNCIDTQRCDNTIGSYSCVRVVGCGTGYTLNAQLGLCEDDDECALGWHDCHRRGADWRCVNTRGSYKCQRTRCPAGTTLTADKQHCVPSTTNFGDAPLFGWLLRGVSDAPQTIRVQLGVGSRQRAPVSSAMCGTGYELGSQGRCQDVDECASMGSAAAVCVWSCVNTVGSFRCHCPAGYRLAVDGSSCMDIDECQELQPCDELDVCLNIRGGHRCNQIVCPSGYVREPEHKNRCRRNSLFCSPGDTACLKQPLSYSFNYLTFAANLSIPASGRVLLFTMRGPLWPRTSARFHLHLEPSTGDNGGVAAASETDFHLHRSRSNQAAVLLTSSLAGPQEVRLTLTMELYEQDEFSGRAVARLFLFVSQYEF